MDTCDEELPWPPGGETAFTRLLPQDVSLASFYKPDVWHCVNMGVGKGFCASALVVLLSLDHFGMGSVETKLARMTSEYYAFCSNSVPRLILENPSMDLSLWNCLA